MTEINPSQLEQDLTAMTHVPDQAPHLWQRALEATQTRSNAPLRLREWFDRIHAPQRRWFEIAALLVVVVAVSVLALSEPLSRARNATVSINDSARGRSFKYGEADRLASSPATRPEPGYIELRGGLESGGADFGPSDGAAFGRRASSDRERMPAYAGGLVVQDGSALSNAQPEQRQVVRKASVELRTADVRAAFVKVQMLVSETGSEYIENSSISGEGEQMQADLTLRVAASRLSEVLNALRDIANVASQQLSGEDVTAQVVDIEARLNNERRVEAELLELLAARQDADLKDVLELRTHIGQVREQIERLQAQQQHLSRLVSLATVLIIIRHDGQPAAPEETSIGAYFADVMKSAWERGITGLADSIAWIAATLLGGLIWWTIAAIALWIAWRRFAVLRATAGSEPRP